MAIYDFEKGNDPLKNFRVGLIHKVVEWLEANSITPSIIESKSEDGNKVFHVDVNGDVILEGYHLNDIDKIPSYIKFRNVKGRFILTNNN
jgi:hypothetical protein